MGERQLIMNVISLDVVKQPPEETLSSFYGHFHKNLTGIDHRVSDGKII